MTAAAATQAYSQRLQTPIELFVCPTRRALSIWNIADSFAYVRTPKPYGDVAMVARADYAINGGSSHVFSSIGPIDFAQGDDPKYWKTGTSTVNFSGISHMRTAVAARRISDGLSSTYLVGEKSVETDQYATGQSIGDNESMYAGYCTDLHRFAGAVERIAMPVPLPPFVQPLNDNETATPAINAAIGFGSAHATGFHMAYCDGATHFIGYDIDPEVHFRAGHRSDGGAPLNSLYKN